MTREEAIEFGNMWLQMNEDCKDSHTYMFFKMAIKTLEQEPCEDCCNGNQIEKAKLCQKSYLAGMEHKQEPCEDAVSRKEVINQIFYSTDNSGDVVLGAALRERIARLRPITPQQKTGHWEYIQYDKPPIGNWHCTECGRIVFLLNSQKSGETPLYNYCPWCGAKMVDPQESEDKE